MKRLLLSVPILFVIMLNACGGNPSALISSDVGTAVGQTQTAAVWTPPPTQTFNPNIPNMISTLNADLSLANPLEWTLDAEYRVDNVSFPNVPNSPSLLFRVDVRCQCRNGEDCCHPERTFVAVVSSMKRNYYSVLAYAPGNVSQLLVVCSDGKSFTGAMTAGWTDVREYLIGNLTGYQFGVRVTKADIPK